MENNDEIIFKDIPGFPGYQAGSDGSIWSCWSIANQFIEARMTNKWKKLNGFYSAGAINHDLIVNKKKMRVKGHHLVLFAFVGPRPDGMICRHFPDSNPKNNKIENLQWGTQSENEKDKIIHGTSNRGSRQGRSKLNEEKVMNIRKLLKEGKHKKDIAIELQISITTIYDIESGRSWAWLENINE